MSQKSVKRLLTEAAELAAVMEITRDELTACSIYGMQTVFHLRPLALARVFRTLGLPKSRLTVEVHENDAHLTFTARGVVWTTVVRNKDRGEAWWHELLGEQPKIAARPLPLLEMANA